MRLSIAQRRPKLAAASPTAPATADSTSASANICATMRLRLAPSALLTTISLSRVAARANISSATLPHTSTSSTITKPLRERMPMESASGRSRTLFVYGITRGRRCRCVAAKSAEVRRPSAASSACASRSETPGARPTRGSSPRAYSSGLRRSGVHTLWATGKPKPCGITPTTVARWRPRSVLHRGALAIWLVGRAHAEQRDTVDRVLSFYGDRSADWLSALTHAERPWKEAREDLPEGERGDVEITRESMPRLSLVVPDRAAPAAVLRVVEQEIGFRFVVAPDAVQLRDQHRRSIAQRVSVRVFARRRGRVRGLYLPPGVDRTVPAGDFAWFQRRFQSLGWRRCYGSGDTAVLRSMWMTASNWSEMRAWK